MFFFLKPIKWAIQLFSLLVLAAIVYSVVCAVGVVRAESQPAPPSGATAIVVSGSALNGGAPSTDLVARLNAALTLYRANAAPKIVVAGPSSNGASLAAAAATWLQGQSVPASAITQVSTSNATEFANVAKSIPKGSSVLIVTDAVDARWALDAASSAGLHPSASIVPGSKKFFISDIGSVIEQATGVAAGKIIGYDHAVWAAS
jgi:uncharacterized SAM-binding protein YcdF (DUF218 family)